jgi:hypothetical protein
MSKKLISLAVTAVSGTAFAWGVACSSGGGSSNNEGSSSSSSSSGGGTTSSSSGGGTTSSSSGGSSSGGGGTTSSSSGGHDAGFGCTGSAAGKPLIDNMSAPTGTGVAFAPPSCGAQGSWFDYGAAGGTIGNPPNAPMSTPAGMTFSPLPAGLPAEAGAPPTAEGGTAEGGISGPKAACISGATGSAAYSTEGMGLNFAITPNPDGGDGTPVPINASSYTGIQFWAWGGLDAGMQSIILNVPDENETPGLGVCNPTATAGTACGGATLTKTIGPGWQLVQAPFAAFLDNTYYGGSNEMMLDNSGLTQIQWQVQLVAPDGGAPVPFNFCVYDVSFYM